MFLSSLWWNLRRLSNFLCYLGCGAHCWNNLCEGVLLRAFLLLLLFYKFLRMGVHCLLCEFIDWAHFISLHFGFNILFLCTLLYSSCTITLIRDNRHSLLLPVSFSLIYLWLKPVNPIFSKILSLVLLSDQGFLGWYLILLRHQFGIEFFGFPFHKTQPPLMLFELLLNLSNIWAWELRHEVKLALVYLIWTWN